MEEREKVVRHMWDVYTSSNRRIRLAKFWEDAFKSAYEYMNSDVLGVREAAVSEIAKMSLRSIRLEPPPTAHSLVSSTIIHLTILHLTFFCPKIGLAAFHTNLLTFYA